MAPDPQDSSHVDNASTASAPVEAAPAAAAAAASSPDLVHRERTKADFEKYVLDQYVNRDLVHTASIVADQHSRAKQYTHMKSEIDDYRKTRTDFRQWFPLSRLYGEGYNGYGNGHTDGQTKVVYPGAKPRLGHRKTRQLRVKRRDMAQQAEAVEELVPVRLDVDFDKIKLRDTFTWNLHDRTVSPDLFAAQLVEDLGLATPAANPVLEQVQQQLHEQLTDFYPQVYFEEDALDPELPYSAYKNEEMRIVIKLNITIGPTTLEDKFEWELNNPLNSPEEFAQSMSREMSLAGEFTTAIAHCIREQCQLFTRSLYIVGHPFDGRPLEDADLINAFCQTPITTALRPQQQAREYAPYLYEMTEADLERSEVIYSREQRRQKRSVNRRGGPTLPDLKDRQRTVRTLIVSSVLPGAADTIEDSRIYKRVGGPSGRGKRAAGKGDGDLSESSDSDNSSPESPAMSNLLSGTARTRGMRGAATAAQQRMANIGRSETPEAAIMHHHETRTSARRFVGRDAREESLDSPSLVIKLKIGKEKLRKLVRDLKAGNRPSNIQQTPSFNRSQSARGTPVPGSMGPPSTPGAQNQQLQPSTSTPAPQVQIGRVDAPPPPASGQPAHAPPPPPSWLTDGLTTLLTTYPSDRFEGVMRYSPVNSATEMPCPAPAAGQPTPEGIKWMYLPRIRCHDCPGKLYTPGPETTVGNFEVHLKNRQHRERVEARSAVNQGASASDGGGF
ncbi:SWI/SNF chromatin-remodeling complex subunit [Lachnellula occidentalis]|uniref:SWI/SNF chromatin-remodeling complex subunit n=1 Tax=Lachnellula occidentalis TaxID=215460 RepID=A0A8H8S824_9HELO|nr:SWI/SNF chromatin-remodeling complex subunit [Lachnellula occidentalis]